MGTHVKWSGSLHHTIHINLLNMDQRPNLRINTIKLIEEKRGNLTPLLYSGKIKKKKEKKTGEKSSWPWIWQCILKSNNIWENKKKTGLYQVKNICFSKDTMKKVKRTYRMGRGYRSDCWMATGFLLRVMKMFWS